MKRIFIILTSIICLTSFFCFNASASNISVYVDNELTELMDANGNTVYPFIQNGTTYIPVRGISQALGCAVKWDSNNHNVMIYKDIEPDNKVFHNDSNEVRLYVDNEEKTLYDANGTEVKPFIKNGTTYVPLRGVSNVLGYYIEWDGQTKSVYVWKDRVSPNGVPLNFLRPYGFKHSFIYTAYESDGGRVEIDGKYYTNALSGWWGSALFNLDGKYDTLTCVLGATGDFNVEKIVTFIVDSKISKTVVIEPNSRSEKINVDLQKGLQLEIMIDGSLALGDITFYGD